jgi:lipid-A-disaccharide synthase
MRIFLCAGEPSGDVHGANLIRALRQRRPDVECVGFGGDAMEAAGCRLLYSLCSLAVMWFLRVLLQAPRFLRLLALADRHFRDERPDAVVLIDFPGFNWHVARLAHARGIPVFYFVAPQLWAWAGWRVKKMRRWVDHVLCTLPFEETWYRERQVSAHYIGHPYFDELTQQRPDAGFLARQRAQPGPIIALLPGSRNQEVERNLPTMVRAAEMIHSVRSDVRFLVACLKPAQQEYVEEYLRRRGPGAPPVEVYSGRTPEVIQAAHACVAVSGSVGLELLYHGKPAVVVYRMLGRIDLFVGHWFMKCRYISLVNLLADQELFPEYLSDRCEAVAVSEHILHWLNEPAAYDAVCRELAALRQRVAAPGACERAAGYLLETLAEPSLAAVRRPA